MKTKIVPSNNLALLAVAVCAAMLAFTQNASATPHPLPFSPAHLLAPQQFFTQSPLGNGPEEAAYLSSHGYTDECCQYLGKYNQGGPFENGAINISQFVTVTEVSANSWDITWNLTGSGFTLCGVLIKDGKVQGSGHLYRFYGVSPDEALVGSGTVTFDNPVRGISHISFFGCAGQGVPDGGTTVTLLGAALGALGIVRRYLAS